MASSGVKSSYPIGQSIETVWIWEWEQEKKQAFSDRGPPSRTNRESPLEKPYLLGRCWVKVLKVLAWTHAAECENVVLTVAPEFPPPVLRFLACKEQAGKTRYWCHEHGAQQWFRRRRLTDTRENPVIAIRVLHHFCHRKNDYTFTE